MSEVIGAKEIDKFLKKIPEWEYNEKALIRVFEFNDFSEGMDFANGVAEISETLDNYPEIVINWSTVNVSFSNSKDKKITDIDFDHAKKIDTLID